MRRHARIGVLEGATVLVALLCVPAALVLALRAPVATTLHPIVVGLVAVAVLAWTAVVVGLSRLVVQQLRGDALAEQGPLSWAAIRVATVVLLVAPFLDATHGAAGPRAATAPPTAPATVAVTGAPRSPSLRPATRTHSAPRGGRCRHESTPAVPLGSSAVLLALAGDARRARRLRRRLRLDDDGAVDLETVLLARRATSIPPIDAVAGALAAAGRLGEAVHVVLADGAAWVDGDGWQYDATAPRTVARCLVVVLGELAGQTHVALVPRGAVLSLAGPGCTELLEDAVRVGDATRLGRPVASTAEALERTLALREDDDVVVCVDDAASAEPSLRARCAAVDRWSLTPLARVDVDEVRLGDGRVLVRAALAPSVRGLLDGAHDESAADPAPLPRDGRLDDGGVVVRLLAPVPRVDGLEVPLEPGRERRAVELVAYLALRDTPVTGERLRVRVLGTSSTDAAAKTLFNVASGLRRALGDGPFGPRLPPAGRIGRYAVAPDVRCDVGILEARVERAGRCEDEEEAMAWLRGALELVEGEPFATVLEGYDWFLAEGHLTRLQAVCEDAACDLVALALRHGLLALAALAIERASLVDPYSERLADAAMRVAAARQASLDAMEPAARRTVPSAPATT